SFLAEQSLSLSGQPGSTVYLTLPAGARGLPARVGGSPKAGGVAAAPMSHDATGRAFGETGASRSGSCGVADHAAQSTLRVCWWLTSSSQRRRRGRLWLGA